MIKVCTQCFCEKLIIEFYKDITKKDHIRPECKNCTKINSKKHRTLNHTEFRIKRNKYEKKKYYENLDKSRVKYKKYFQKAKNNINARNRKRRLIDPIFKLKSCLRSRVRGSLKMINHRKNNKTEEILGCSFELAKQHIEQQFKPGMTWNNHGRGEYCWHIDHIIPLALAKTVEQVINLCHYTNLQPLWEKENLYKKDKIINI